MGIADRVDVEISAEELEWLLAEDEAAWCAHLEEQWATGRELFLDNLPLSWCQNPAQMDGWLGMLPAEEQPAALETVADVAPANDGDDIPF